MTVHRFQIVDFISVPMAASILTATLVPTAASMMRSGTL